MPVEQGSGKRQSYSIPPPEGSDGKSLGILYLACISNMYCCSLFVHKNKDNVQPNPITLHLFIHLMIIWICLNIRCHGYFEREQRHFFLRHSLYIYISMYKHTHTHIYIYIYNVFLCYCFPVIPFVRPLTSSIRQGGMLSRSTSARSSTRRHFPLDYLPTEKEVLPSASRNVVVGRKVSR